MGSRSPSTTSRRTVATAGVAGRSQGWATSGAGLGGVGGGDAADSVDAPKSASVTKLRIQLSK